MDILITNNPLAVEKFSATHQVKFFDCPFLQVLNIVRDHIHQGHKLLSHPLSGSVKPHETPYKSVVICGHQATLCHLSLTTIENAVALTKNFVPRQIPIEHLADLKMIDCSLLG